MWNVDDGFCQSTVWVDGTKWDLDTKTLTFDDFKLVYSNEIVQSDYTGQAKAFVKWIYA